MGERGWWCVEKVRGAARVSLLVIIGRPDVLRSRPVAMQICASENELKFQSV